MRHMPAKEEKSAHYQDSVTVTLPTRSIYPDTRCCLLTWRTPDSVRSPRNLTNTFLLNVSGMSIDDLIRKRSLTLPARA